MHYLVLVLCLIFAYLSGSIPFGYLYAKRATGNKHFDIRDWGSANIGFTNVWKVLGIKIGLPVLAADILKGALPVLLCKALFGEYWGALALILAALGHNLSIYFFLLEKEFSGGKAVATSLGGILVLQPIIALVALIVWAIVLKTSKYMSVASLSATLASFVCAIALGKGSFWYVFFGVIFLGISFTHWRNIGRLINGIEPKITENRGAGGLDPRKRISAFLLHPITMEDIRQMVPWLVDLLDKKVISERDIRRIIRHCPVSESAQVMGIKTLNGFEGVILLFVIPLLPDQIKDPRYSNVLMAMLKAGIIQAQRRGAPVVTFGALLSTVGNGGADLQEWATARGLTIKVDNGAAFTVASTLMMLENIGGRSLSEQNVAIIGATGYIAGTLSRSLTGSFEPKSLTHYVRDERKITDPDARAKCINSADLSGLIEADIVICLTSSPKCIITLENCHFLKQGAIILDVAVPADFDDAVLTIRPDVKLVRCGLIGLPGDDIELRIDLHFGSFQRNGKTIPCVPACMAQGAMLSWANPEDLVHASTGKRIRTEDIEFFVKFAEETGVEVVPSQLVEQDVFQGVVAK